MGGLRKMGVWLGLVEEDDDRPYDPRYEDDFDDEDDDFDPPARPRALSRAHTSRATTTERSVERLAERSATSHTDRHTERGHADRVHSDRLHTERGHTDRSGLGAGLSERTGERPALTERVLTERTGEHSRVLGGERSSVRPLARPASSATSYPTQDGLALVPPQTQLRDRAVPAEDPERRYQITTLHPTTYTEARTIGEHFRDGVPVIINLTEMDEADARRLVDFAAGLAFGLRGNIERVTNRVFLLSPANVQVTAEDKAKIAEGGFFDQS